MKKIVFCFLLTVLAFNRSSSQTSVFTEDEKAIYNLLIAELQINIDTNFKADRVVGYEIRLGKETINQYSLLDGHRHLREHMKDTNLVKDLKSKNRIAYPTKGFEIKKSPKQSSKKRINYVDVVFSRCGFSSNEALVYMGVQYDKLSGYGDLVLLEKDKEGNWKVIKRFTKWAS